MMSSSKWSVLLHKLSHRFTVSDPFVTLSYFGEHYSFWSMWFFLIFVIHLLSEGLFFHFGNEYIFDQFSIFFAFLELNFFQCIFDLFFLSSFEFLLLDLLNPHIFRVFWHMMINRLCSLFFCRPFLLFHYHIFPFMVLNLSKINILLFNNDLFL